MSWLEFALTPGLRKAVQESLTYATKLKVGVMVTRKGNTHWAVSLSGLVPIGEVRRVPETQLNGVVFRSSTGRWPHSG